MNPSAPRPQGDLPASVGAFDFQTRTRIVFADHSLALCGELAKELGISRVLLVTDPGIVAAGHAATLEKILQAAGLSVTSFTQVQENPGTRCVEACVAAAKNGGIDGFIALGGGSSMDTAKGCNFILTNGGTMRDYWGFAKAPQPMLPLIAIPTTAGTGSECQSYALISDETTHQKMACGDPKAAPRIAVLDPVLTLSQPARVTACTGLDALAHAIESAVTTRRSLVSSLLAREAFRLCWSALPRVLSHPAGLPARGQMLLGAAWVGLAIENSMLGAAHSAANPLTAHFGIAHGQAVAMVLPEVIRFNAAIPLVDQIYAELLHAAGVAPGPQPGEFLARELEVLRDAAGLRIDPGQLNLSSTRLEELGAEAARQWTAQFNPRPIAASDFVRIYSRASATKRS